MSRRRDWPAYCAKRATREVVIEMLCLNTTLERTEQPPLEQRGDVMNARHDFVSLFVPDADDRNTMLVARSRKPRIDSCASNAEQNRYNKFFLKVNYKSLWLAFPPGGVNCRAKLGGLSNEVQQAFGADVLDAFESDTPDSSDRSSLPRPLRWTFSRSHDPVCHLQSPLFSARR